MPGCSGKTDNFVKTNYCIKGDSGTIAEVTDDIDIANAATATGADTTDSQQKRPTGTLNVVGQNGFPASVYPLGVCEGECDEDADVSRSNHSLFVLHSQIYVKCAHTKIVIPVQFVICDSVLGA